MMTPSWDEKAREKKQEIASISCFRKCAVGYGRRLELVAEGKLLDAREGKRGAIDAQLAATYLLIESAIHAYRVGVEADRVGHIEDFPGETERLFFVDLPGLMKA